MLSQACLAEYEAFRKQVRTNPNLTDDWGGARRKASASSTGGILTILERPGVGASNVAYHVIRGLSESGIAQHTLGYGDPGSIGDLACHWGFEEAINLKDGRASWEALVERTRSVLNQCRPQAIVAHREFPWAWILSEIVGVRRIVMCHGGPFTYRVMDTPLEQELAERLQRVDRVAVPSRFMREHLRHRCGLKDAHTQLMRGAYDPELFHPGGRTKSEGSLRVIFVGRLEPDKGPDRFVKAVKLALEQNCSLQATVLGDGRMRSELEQSCHGTPIHFEGSVSSRVVAETLRSSDVILVPSRTEGLGLQTIEALACRVPVVAARVGGLQELVSESGAGLLVESTEEMADSLVRLSEDEELREALAHKGPDFLAKEPMDWDSLVRKWKAELSIS